jgi:type II secretory pathway predicted ATPase ExeA
MKDTPFSTSPNPANLYLTSSLKASIHKTKYTIDRRRGLTCLLGDVGMGKSSVLRLLHAEYSAREDVSVCLIPTPSFTSEFGLLKGICGDFGVGPKKSLYDQEQAIRGFLLKEYEADRNVVVFIDEAQRLNSKMLELVRSMCNYETSTSGKLIQLVLAAQLELKDRLLDPSKKAIRSRIFAPSILDPLTLGETKAMIDYRCERAEIKNPIPDPVAERIYDITGGIPRDILTICDVAYELMRLRGDKIMSPELLEVAAQEAVLA